MNSLPFSQTASSTTLDPSTSAVPATAASSAFSVLLVDDDIEMGRMLADFMINQHIQLQLVHDGALAAAALQERKFDLVLLDVMLPGRSGFDILRELRRHSSLPVIMLTARGNDTDRIVGLELGADDYLPKPFNPRELSARIRAVLRRGRSEENKPAASDDGTLRCGVLAYCPRTLEARLDGSPVRLTGAEGRILEILMRSAGRMVGREPLSQWALGRKLLPQDRSLDTHTSNLRRKLRLSEASPGRPELRSVRGQGYMLVGDDFPAP